MRMFNPPHPRLLIKEYIEGFESNVSVFAQKLGVTRVTFSRIVNGKFFGVMFGSIHILECSS